jgi:chromosome segregation and condensation protein ScpB
MNYELKKGFSPMQLETLERKIEAILFASGEPLEGEKIAEALDIEEITVKHLI